MGKKDKTGKARKDKFYHLAKETGFRSRAAFKLLQLNRKYNFLESARVCVDLCAAPGGWLQVAAQHMPVSSVIVGVDLVPIRSVARCTTFQGDITTDKCRQQLRKELQTWDADVVLHDGAPNVGKSWVHDAFQQAELTLAALSLAATFLKKGGVFVTKVFRSKDYHALMWVFNQLFKKVFATKPQASRNESAEIFVVCQYFIKPDKMDPKFLDPKHVFKDVANGGRKALNIIHPGKDKKKAHGYADEDKGTLHHSLAASTFLSEDNFLELLGDTHQLVLDEPRIADHDLTTAEIREYCQDIMVLGKKELRQLLAWRKKLRGALKDGAESAIEGAIEEGANEESAMEEGAAEEGTEGATEEGPEEDGEDEEDDDDLAIGKQIADLKEEEMRDQKRKKKKVQKEKKKLRDKMNLKMVIKGDKLEMGVDQEMFSIDNIKSAQHLSAVAAAQDSDVSESEDEDEARLRLQRKNVMTYEREANVCDDAITDSEAEEEEEELHESGEESGEEPEEASAPDGNPLVVDLDVGQARAAEHTERWFAKGVFAGVEAEGDEDIDLHHMTSQYTQQGGKILGKDGATPRKAQKRKRPSTEDDVDRSCGEEQDMEQGEGEEEDSDSDSDYDDEAALRPQQDKTPQRAASSAAGFEVVAAPKRKLDAEGLAMGAELIKSVKHRREIVELSYNRYTCNDDNLPDWFAKDEARHNRLTLPLTKEQVDVYKERQKAIDARPIKKIAEAKARKKRKSVRRLEKARKKADEVSEQVDVTDKEKMAQMKQIYKRAGLLGTKKEEVTYVVVKRGAGRKVSRPPGVKGKFKVVDPRLKKDLRKQKINDKKNKGKKGPKPSKPGPPAGRRKPHRK